MAAMAAVTVECATVATRRGDAVIDPDPARPSAPGFNV
ncbi:hypothetical protein J2T05_002921 [Cupriavidus necator]|nr:hypothetical protein [Cupriavidus necator]